MKNKLKYMILLSAVFLCFTSCIPAYDYEEHYAEFYVCNFTDQDLVLKVNREIKGESKGSYSSKTIMANSQSTYLENPAVTLVWVPGKYYKDIDGFCTSNKFSLDFYINKQSKQQHLELSNVDDGITLSSPVTFSVWKAFSVHKTFIPGELCWEDYEAVLNHVAEEDQDLVRKFYKHYVMGNKSTPQDYENLIRYLENLALNDSQLKLLMKITDFNEKNYVAFRFDKDYLLP